jgi:hypothetical protein
MGGGYSASGGSSSSGDIGGAAFGGVNIGMGGGIDQNTLLIIAGVGLAALLLLRR